MKFDINPRVLGRAVTVLGALNNKSRRLIVEAMRDSIYMTVSEIKERAPHLSNQNLSNHLRKLKKAGLVQSESPANAAKGWPQQIYSLQRDKLQKLMEYANFLAAFPPDVMKREPE